VVHKGGAFHLSQHTETVWNVTVTMTKVCEARQLAHYREQVIVVHKGGACNLSQHVGQ